MWYLLNEYYLCLHFEPRFYRLIFPRENRYFQKFQFEILKNDAYNGDWKKYLITEHPRFGHKIIIGCIIAKLNSKKDIRVEGIFHPSEMHQVTNPYDTLHLHMDTTWASCHHALTKVESLNKGTLSETGPSTLEAYRQQWPHVDLQEMPNPFIGYDDPYYDDHDPDFGANVDKEWFQGKDGQN